MNIGRFPPSSLFASSPAEWARQVEEWSNKLAGECERVDRDLHTPAKTPIVLTNVATPTTSLDGGASTVAEVRDFALGLSQTLIAKGFLRTKAGAN
jgi:hypothetical protein